MVEQSPKQTPKPSWRESPHLSFAAQSLKLPGDPETPSDFNRAFSYLDQITTHFQEFGPLKEKTAIDLEHELAYHNTWHEYEIAQERKAGITEAEYREINLYQLRALSKRRLLAKAEAGKVDGASTFVDQLIEQAIADEEALERLTMPTPDEPLA